MAGSGATVSQGYDYALTATKSDTVNIDGTTDTTVRALGGGLACAVRPKITQALHVGGAGVVAAVFPDDSIVNITAIAGQMLPIQIKRVNSTNTTATVMTGYFDRAQFFQ